MKKYKLAAILSIESKELLSKGRFDSLGKRQRVPQIKEELALSMLLLEKTDAWVKSSEVLPYATKPYSICRRFYQMVCV